MITLLGALFGFLGSAFPELIKWLNKKEDNKHELALTDKQIEMQKLLGTQRLEEIIVAADSAEMQALYKSAVPVSGVKWVMALSDTVRPIITYCFFICYLVVKVAQYHMLTTPELLPWLNKTVQLDWNQALIQLWTPEDGALFAAIISFWFGARSFRKK